MGVPSIIAAATDKSFYNAGEMITLTINILLATLGSQLVVNTKAPNGHVPFITTLYNVEGGCTYTVKIPTGTSDWQQSGNYQIEMQLGNYAVQYAFFNYNM